MALLSFLPQFQDVEELMFERGVVLTYETVRAWCEKFGRDFAKKLKWRRPRLGDKWHLAEVFLIIKGQRSYLWRAVDQDGQVLDILVQSKRNKRAAKKLLKGLQYAPHVIITDRLRSYGAAKEDILPGVEHRQHKGLNNRAENSHQPTRERRMQHFKSLAHDQKFLSAYSFIASHFRPKRHLLSAPDYRRELRQRFVVWREVTDLQLTA